ncbi:UNVERIFIED_CONTAM: hypothetical protein Sradi_3610400 [Sesamum radiatum]|uniref:Retrotransposon gag domain-containing protein n=1 Tax=Sesamum radiatum TaxID=300843 RepID=A0AAW2QH67_SESRA
MAKLRSHISATTDPSASNITSPQPHITVLDSSNPLPPIQTTPHLLKPPKISLPFFDGSNPLDWLFQANQYFTYYQTPPPDRLPLISFYMHRPALSWYKWMDTNQQLTTWHAFTHALELRFGPTTYDNHQAELFKLRQTTTIADYQLQFERLCNCVVGLSLDAILNCFLSVGYSTRACHS